MRAVERPENKETLRSSRHAAQRGAALNSLDGSSSRGRIPSGGTPPSQTSLISRLSTRTEYSLEWFFGIPDVSTTPRDFFLSRGRIAPLDSN